ncbi:MAG: hypothetical protein NC131_01050 [Roseburia sp.]|nr:hypothetical protein [Roseburia sp.]
MRIGDSVWFSKRISKENAENAEYDKPVEIKTKFNYLTIQPATAKGYIAIVEYGEKLSDIWSGVANGKRFKDYFHKGDVMWVDGESPYNEQNAPLEKEYDYGCTANAVIKDVAIGNIVITLTLERNQNQVRQ